MEAATIEETELERKQRERAEREAEGEGSASGEGEGQGEGEEGAAGEGEGADGESGEGEPAGEGATAEHEGEKPGEGEGEQPKPELAIQVGGKLNSTIGGESPDTSTVRLRGGSIAIAGGGQLKKGEVRNLLVKVRVGEVHLVDKEDRKTGEIIETERRHITKIIGVEVVE